MSTFPPYNLTHWFRIVPYDAETSLALNVYGTSGPGNNVNVNLYSQTNDTEQFWRVEARSNGAFIINRRNEAFALDWYSPNNNCDVYTLAGNETDANIDLLTRSDSYGNYYLIKNVSSGKYLTVDNAIAISGANVIWADYKGTGLDGRQRWRFVQGDAYTSNDNGDHLIVNNSVYEFVSLKSLTNPEDAANPTKALNMWGSAAGNNVNVNLYTADHSITQRWKAVRYSETDDTWFLASMADTNYVLDRYRGSAALNNADLYPKGTTAADRADQLVHFTLCGTYGAYQVYYIDMASDGLRLSAVDCRNGSGTGKTSTSTGNVYFGSGTSDLQKWVAIPSNDSNYFTYPCSIMRITQQHDNYYTPTPEAPTPHSFHNVHNTSGDGLVDYPIDEGCNDTGRSYMYCPCDEMEVVRIHGVGNDGTNTVWLRSTTPAKIPGRATQEYVVMMVEHMNDSCLNAMFVGQKFTRGQAMFMEGNNGCTAYHFHISCGIGELVDNGWLRNSKGAWVIRTTGGPLYPQDAFYVDPSFTTISNSKNYTFTTKP